MPWPAVRERMITITSWSDQAVGAALAGMGLFYTDTSVTPVANLAVYIPFVVQEPLVVVKMFTPNRTGASGNIDVGIYSADGTRLVSAGSTAFSPSTVQIFDITDTMIGPGQYYLAVATNSTTPRLNGGSTASNVQRNYRMVGVMQQATAFALPASATFALYAQDFLPMVSLTGRTLV